jgi:translation initiation factor IF-1
MVRNDAGGNKGKGLARKHVNAAKGGGSKQLRVATDAAEKYAVVSKMLGNGMCYVNLLDGTIDSKLCIIRNKFKGRGKRDNILNTGSWVLVGLRDWSSKQDTCDLLEVYNDGERDRLRKNEPCFKAVICESTNESGSGGNVSFVDNETMKYSALVKRKSASHTGVDDDDDDDDDGELMQQRVYDMPPSDSDSDESSDSESESSDSVHQSPPAPLPTKPKIEKMDYINVDDI